MLSTGIAYHAFLVAVALVAVALILGGNRNTH